MKKIKLAKLLAQINILFFVLYNVYFGFNSHPLTEIEENCDAIFSIVMKVVIFIYILPLFTLYESTIESKDNITGDNVVDESP